MKILIAFIFALLLATPASAANWGAAEGEMRYFVYAGTTGPDDVADFSSHSPRCTHIVAAFTPEHSAVNRDTDAAGDLWQCKSTPDDVSNPGATSGCKKKRSYATGNDRTPFDLVMDARDGEFFQWVPVVAAGSGNAGIMLGCARKPLNGGAAWIGEIIHATISAGDKDVIKANPYRTKLIVYPQLSITTPVYWASEEGGLGGSGTCANSIGIRADAGQAVSIEPEDGAAGRSCIGADLTGGSGNVRVFEVLTIP